MTTASHTLMESSLNPLTTTGLSVLVILACLARTVSAVVIIQEEKGLLMLTRFTSPASVKLHQMELETVVISPGLSGQMQENQLFMEQHQQMLTRPVLITLNALLELFWVT